MWGGSWIPTISNMIVVIGKIGGSGMKSFKTLFPNGDTTTCTFSATNRKKKMAGRGLPTNNIPVVIAAATGYIYYVQ